MGARRWATLRDLDLNRYPHDALRAEAEATDRRGRAFRRVQEKPLPSGQMDRVVQAPARPGLRLASVAGSLAALLLLGALAAGCSPAPRPEFTEWRGVWAGERARLPAAGELGAPGARAVCERLLVSSRRARRSLLPAPDAALDRATEGWIERAESLAFNCPGAKGDTAALRSAMQELDELAAEIEAALQVTGDAPGSGPPAGSV